MVISLKYYRFSQCKQTICPSLLRDDEPCSETGDGPCPGRCLSLLLIIVLFMMLRCSCSGSTAEAPLQVVGLGCRETSTLGLPASNRTRRIKRQILCQLGNFMDGQFASNRARDPGQTRTRWISINGRLPKRSLITRRKRR